MSSAARIEIDAGLVQGLIADQFPQWAGLPIRPVVHGGWDNRSFHLGDALVVRLPSAGRYAEQAAKEHLWLPSLAPHLPFEIPEPVAAGAPGRGFPWDWSVRRWIPGAAARQAPPADALGFARDLAAFLKALHAIDATDGPEAGRHNFFRGGPLATYNAQTREALDALDGRIDTAAARLIWDAALATTWDAASIWVHGDVAPGNLIVRDGRLAAVIDFGTCGVGDPACDLAIAWTTFEGPSREAFRAALSLDAACWARARGWALWKALILAAGFSGDHPDVPDSWRVIDEVLAWPAA